jgi:hypothetical protein
MQGLIRTFLFGKNQEHVLDRVHFCNILYLLPLILMIQPIQPLSQTPRGLKINLSCFHSPGSVFT